MSVDALLPAVPLDAASEPCRDDATEDVSLALMEAALRSLEHEMPDWPHRHRDMFSYANAWAERHDALLAATPARLRPLLEQRLHRIGVRWGVVHGVRMTAQFPAITLGD